MLAGKHAGVQAAGPGKEKPQRMQAWGWRTLLGGGVMRGPHPLNRLDQHNVPRGIWRLRRRHSDPLHRAIRSRSTVARASASSASSTAIRRSALASSCRTFSFSVRRRARMLVLDSAGICIPKEKPQQGRQGFWKRTPLGGMGCEGPLHRRIQHA